MLWTRVGKLAARAIAAKAPELQPQKVALVIVSLSIRPMICVASFEPVMAVMAESGAVLRDMPGISNVVTVKEGARIEATVAKFSQSPSPEGIRTKSGPVPRRSQYQDIPSWVSTVDTVGPDMAMNACAVPNFSI